MNKAQDTKALSPTKALPLTASNLKKMWNEHREEDYRAVEFAIFAKGILRAIYHIYERGLEKEVLVFADTYHYDFEKFPSKMIKTYDTEDLHIIYMKDIKFNSI